VKSVNRGNAGPDAPVAGSGAMPVMAGDTFGATVAPPLVTARRGSPFGRLAGFAGVQEFTRELRSIAIRQHITPPFGCGTDSMLATRTGVQAVLRACHCHGSATVRDRWRPLAGPCGTFVPGGCAVADLAARDLEMGHGHGVSAGLECSSHPRAAGPAAVALPSCRPRARRAAPVRATGCRAGEQ
jgi:hypothetical protein